MKHISPITHQPLPAKADEDKGRFACSAFKEILGKCEVVEVD